VLSGGAAYTDAKFKDYVNDDPLQYGVQLVQLAGNTPQLTPKWKAYAAAEYSIPLPSDAELGIRADATYVGAQFFDEFDRAPMLTGGYTLYDASLTYRPISRKWSAMLWGKNLANEKKIVDASFSANGLVTSKKFIDPATYGVSLNYSF
jgi:iron complex outermembrane receptor protein